jgi:Carboxypeptidase regulatory-like domain
MSEKAAVMHEGSRPRAAERRQIRSRFFLGKLWVGGALVLLVSLLTLFPAPLSAQINSGSLQGTVTDASGSAIAGAQITAELHGTGTQRSTISGSSGEYFFTALEPGVYTVSVTKDGFSTYKEPDFTLEVGQAGTLNAALAVGVVSQVVEVSAQTTQIQTADSTLGGVITEREVQDLPLNGRMFTQLLELEPGTVPVDLSQNNGKQPGFGAGSPIPAVNGGTNRSNLFFIDGIYATDPFFAGFSFNPSIDAIQEFKEQTHTDQAEFGGSTGATVIVVSRPGTNTWHGSAFEFLRNDAFDARNYFAPTKLEYRQNQFGGTFGGAVIKNKLFFFANYEGGRQVQGQPLYSFVPTAAERTGDFSGLGPTGQPLPILYDPRTYNPVTQTESTFLAETGKNAIPTALIDPQMQAFLNGTYPMPNSTSVSGNYLSTLGNRGVQDQGQIRIDYNATPSDVIFGRFSKGQATNSSAEFLADTFQTGFSGYNTGVNWVHTFNPTLISTVTVGVSNLDIPQAIVYPVDQGALFTASGLGAGFTTNPGSTSGPQVPAANLSGGPYSGFFNGSGPIGPLTTGQVSASVAKVTGDHVLKFGGAWYKTWMYTNWNGNNDNFSNQGTWNAACQFAATNPVAAAQCPGGVSTAGGDPVASMLLSLPIGANRNLGNSAVSLRMVNTNLFAQDSWKISRKLTFNYGLRWDYNSPVVDKLDRLPTYDIYTQTYLVPTHDADLPSGPLPANVALSGRRSITNPRYADFSPRLGLAYQIDSKTVIRAGFGRSFDSFSEALQVAQQNRGAWPSGLSQNAALGNVNNAGISQKPDGTLYTGENPFFGNPVIPASPLPASSLSFGDVRWQPDSSWQYNLQVQRDLGQIGIASLGYVGSHTEHLNLAYPYNVALQPSPTPCPSTGCNRPDTILGGGATDELSGGTANYNALQANLTRPFVHGFAYNASFTWSRTFAIGNCGDFYVSCIQDPYNLKGEYGPSALDVPIIFTLSALYELPFGKGKQFVNDGVGAALLGGWQLNTIIALRSGLPGTLIDASNNGDQANVGGGEQRGNIVSDPNVGAPHTTAVWFNPAAFAIPAPGTYGDAGINSLRGPGFKDVDFSVFRTFSITERFKLQFRAEMFDLFNHPNFYFGNTPTSNLTLTNGAFNQITSTVNGQGANRDIQFALKLMF